MRITAQVMLGYVLLLAFGSGWRQLPWAIPSPDIAVLVAAYLGITARARIAGAACGAAVLGYFADLIGGTPLGLQATGCSVICMIAFVAQRRLLVRGMFMTVVFASAVAASSMLLYWGMVRYVGFSIAVGSIEGLSRIMVTTLVGPLVFRCAAAVDRRFVRSAYLTPPVFD